MSGCGTGNEYKHLTAAEALNMMQTDKNILILDVRTLGEYEKKHIPNSVLLPIEELRKENFAPLEDKKQKILIYCWTGRRAEDSAKILIEHGYKNVYEFGGLVDWKGELEGSEVEQ
jgi:rhodanese-related sulfurtransferase